MNESEILEACAELDGWSSIHPSGRLDGQLVGYPTVPIINNFEELPKYTTSHDAILPLIGKQSFDIQKKLVQLLDTDFFDSWQERQVIRVLLSTPLQLATALLKAYGKWREA